MCCTANASAYDEAIEKAALAAYKQSGTEEMVNKFVETKIPKEYRDMAAKLLPIFDIGINNKVELKWTF